MVGCAKNRASVQMELSLGGSECGILWLGRVSMGHLGSGVRQPVF